MARFLKAAFGSSVQVETVALSDSVGTATMRVPDDRMLDGCATIEDDNPLRQDACKEITVQTRRLDDYDFRSVGLVKVDVEGHELKVLQGAEGTLRRNRPTLIVEAEERHRTHAVDSVVEFLAALGYRGYFLRGGVFDPIENIDADSGLSAKPYNFVFLTEDAHSWASASHINDPSPSAGSSLA